MKTTYPGDEAEKSGPLFSVREAGEVFAFHFGQAVFRFRFGDGADQEYHIAGQVAHGLKPFQVFFHILRGSEHLKMPAIPLKSTGFVV